MKKFCISFLLVAIIILSGIGLLLPSNTVETEYLRIHIRANSNLGADQNIKYKIKDAVVSCLTPIIAECDTKEKAEKLIASALPKIEKTADGILKLNGFSYTSRAELKNEEFPTRVYGNLTLEKGFYDAIILYLGEGVGDNWWCVVYPPLCFVGSGSPVYRSKIIDIINDFMNRKE